ncbi:MAG: PAS domain S-box protein [Candidatus Methanoperedens sp.]
MMEKAQNLQQTVKFFEKLLRASADGIVITDSAKNIIFVNEKFCKFFSSKIHDVIETNLFIWLEKMDPDARHTWLRLEGQTSQNGMARNVDFAMKTTEGMRYFSVNSSLLEKIDIEEEGLIISIWRDDTGRKVAQEALLKAHDDLEMRVIERTEELQESEERFRGIFEQSPVAIEIYDQTGHLIDANRKCLDLFGIENIEEVKNFNLFDDPNLPVDAKNSLLNREMIEFESTFNFDLVRKLNLYNTTRSGQCYLDLRILPIWNENKFLSGYLVHVLDITERKKAELEREQFFKFFQISSDMMVIADPNGAFKKVNPATSSLLGYSETELMSKPFVDFVHPDDKQSTLDEIARQIKTGSSLNFENRYMCKDGTSLWLSWRANYNKDEGITYATARDITQSKRAEEFASRRNNQLRILSRAAQTINTVLEIPVILQNLIVSAMEITDSTAGTAGLIVNEKITFSEYNEHGKLFPIDYVFKKGYGVPGHVMETKSPYISNDAQNDPYVIQDIRKTLGFNNLANVPILDRKGEILGSFQIHNTKEHRPFDELDIEMLQGLASSAAIALENARLVEDIRKGEEEKISLFSILEKSLNEIYMFDPETLRFTYANSGACRNLGFTLEELQSMTPPDIKPEYDKESFLKLIKPLIRHEKKKLLFYTDHRRANGSLYPVEIHLQLIEQAQRRLFLAFVVDITERKRVEKALSLSEEKYRTLYETMAQGVIYHDESGKIISANPAAQKILGLSPGHLIGRTSIDPMWKAIHEDGSDFPAQKHPAMVTLATRKEVRDVIMGIFNPELKGYRWIQINAIPQTRYAEIKPYQVYTTFNDITELKLAKDEMLLANEELRIINKIISTATGLLDINQIFETVLDECIKIMGLEGGTICLVKPDDHLQLAAQRATSEETIVDLTTNKIRIGECLCGTAARDLKPLILPDREAVIKFATREATRKEDIRYHAAFPLITGGKCLGVLCIFTRTDKKPDVKKLKIIELISSQVALSIRNAQLYEETKEYAKTLETKVEERTNALKESQSGLLNLMEDMNNTTDELEKANKRLIELDRMKSMFIASTSHELRTPLNSIIGFTSILLEGWSGELTPEQREQVQIVNTSGKHLLSLINDVIDISKIEAGKLEVNVSRFNLKGVIDEVVSTLKQELNGKGLSVDIDFIDVELNTDRRRLLQCLINLFSNAVKFTEKGEIKIIAKSINKEIEISIKDTGIGIKKEDIPKLFTAFTRLESSLTAKTSGTGLGLYLTMKLTREVLGGTISVESEVHKGSIFSLRIPREVRI